MATAITQSGRWLSMTTPLGADVLIPTRISGRERLSSLYSFKVECFSTTTTIAPADLLGLHASATVARGDGTTRVFSGIVRSLSAGPMRTATHRSYEIELVPPLWLLTRTSDSKVFQEKTAMEIVEQLLTDAGQTTFKKKTSGTFPTLACCVQYNETDFQFLSRLLESIGVFYFFEQTASATTLVLGDAATAWVDCVDAEAVFRSGDETTAELVTDWNDERRFVSGKWATNDYNFETPDGDLKVTDTTVLTVAAFKTWERFEYPGGYTVKANGTTSAGIRMEEEEASSAEVTGTSRLRGLTPGAKFKLSTHPVAAEAGKSFVVTEVTHEAADPTHFSRDPKSRPSYRNSFACLPDSVLFRPARATPRPRTSGPQTALVVGPAGEEIYCDKYGRIKVQFHWDRIGAKDEKSFCWVRLSQPMAGNKWGTYAIPRVGMEVLVDFLHGDPDQPVVVGCLFNGTNLPPYALPDDRTKSGIKTRSSAQGDATMFNELRFEDKKGSEEVYFHAQKDFKRIVEGDDVLDIEGKRTVTVKSDVSETYEEGKHDLEVKKGAQTIKVTEGNQTITVAKGNQAIDVTKGNQTVEIGAGNQTITVTEGNRKITVGKGDQTIEVSTGDDKLTVKAGNRVVTVTQGDYTLKASGGQVKIEAMTGIELKCGSNSIKIDTTGVTIKGMSVKVTADIAAEIKGATSKLEGSGMVTVKGGVVMIN